MHTTPQGQAASLAQQTAELLLRSSAAPGSPAQPRASTAGGLGLVTASPASPFDVLPVHDALDKLTVLVIDLDSIVLECWRILQCAARPSEPVSSRASAASVSVASASAASASAASAPSRMRLGSSTFFSSASRAVAAVTSPSAKAPPPAPSAAEAPPLPSLSSLLCIFLEKVCSVVRTKRLQVEFVLGDCGDSLGRLNEMGTGREGKGWGHASPPPVTPSLPSSSTYAADGVPPPSLWRGGVEVTALWLEVYQTVVCFMWSGAGADVLSSTALFTTTTGSGWCGAMARYTTHWLREPQVAAKLVFPILCSSDHRAVFAAVSADALLWPAWRTSSLAAPVTHAETPPPSAGHPDRGVDGREVSVWEAPSALGCIVAGAGAEVDDATPLHFRHAASVARRLGLRSVAFLPVLYALLSLCDAVDTVASTAEVVHERVRGADSADGVHPLVPRCAALVDRHCGVLHADLVEAWLQEMRDWGCRPNGGAGGGELAVASGSALDLATALWASQEALAEVSTEATLSAAPQLVPIWAGTTWKYTGPPHLCGHVHRLVDGAPLEGPASSAQTRSSADGGGSSPLPPPHPYAAALRAGARLWRSGPSPRSSRLSLYVAFAPIRWRLACAADEVFGARALAAKSSSVGDGAGVMCRASTALALTAPTSYAFADLHSVAVVDVAAVAAALRAEEEEGGEARAAVGARGEATTAFTAPLPDSWLRACMTRAALDDVRQHVRPAAQLTAVAVAALWRARLWSCEHCLSFFVRFLWFLESPSPLSGGRSDGDGDVDVGAAAVPSTRGLHDSDVAAWWHAVSCFTVLHSLSSSISVAAQAPAMRVGETMRPSHGAASVFAGCLPDATYGTADAVAFASFLRRRGLLLQGGEGDDDVASAKTQAEQHAGASPLSVLPMSDLAPLWRSLRCPSSLVEEAVRYHGILAAMAAAEVG
ncbi:hypothetical protein NESM_000616800 [Novymonas esmeraldas]|uniref:Uncharacterized protein n=1 Tax=Novymonas esmeraldas TaxID=1808958 RepID=A0AAW0ERD3_9TRYP